MRNLVGGDARVAPLETVAFLVGLCHQQAARVGDHADIFHCAEIHGLRNGHAVELVERIRHAEIFLEQLDETRRDLFRIAHLRAAAARRKVAQGDVPGPRRPAVDHVERPDGQGDEIARQRRRGREANAPGIAWEGRFLCNARIADRDHAGRHIERELPRRLPARLIETRKSTARAQRLELGHDIPLCAFLLPEQAARGQALELAAIAHMQPGITRRQRLRRGETDEILCARNGSKLDPPATGFDVCRHDDKIGAVQPQHILRPVQPHFDGNVAFKIRAPRIDGQPHRIGKRHRRIAQPERRRLRPWRQRGQRRRRRTGLAGKRVGKSGCGHAHPQGNHGEQRAHRHWRQRKCESA